MKRNSINFDNKNIEESDFYNKSKKIFNIIHLNTLLGIMIMMLLDHYIYLFHQRLDILINLKKIR